MCGGGRVGSSSPPAITDVPAKSTPAIKKDAGKEQESGSEPAANTRAPLKIDAGKPDGAKITGAATGAGGPQPVKPATTVGPGSSAPQRPATAADAKNNVRTPKQADKPVAEKAAKAEQAAAPETGSSKAAAAGGTGHKIAAQAKRHRKRYAKCGRRCRRYRARCYYAPPSCVEPCRLQACA